MLRIFFLALLLTSSAFADNNRVEMVEETEKTEIKIFCSKSSEKDAVSLCQQWLGVQQKSLGSRLLTSFCGQGEIVSDNPGCLYRATGELRYILKKHRIETSKEK